MEKLNITVMLGGPGAEREVSLRSGQAAAAALASLGHTIHKLDPRTESWELPAETDVVFLALHGVYGEDGTVQQRLEELGVPYTGCDPEASRVAFDKLLTKQRCTEAGVPTARHVVINKPTARWPRGWNPPVVLKPVRQGSSVGLQFVERVADWSAALAESFRHDTQALMEERIVGREVTVGILADEALPVVEVRPRGGQYDYHSKYTTGETEYFCPADFDSETTARIQAAALGAFRAVGGRDYARVDVMMREVPPSPAREVAQASSLSGSAGRLPGLVTNSPPQAGSLCHYEPVVLEVNTLPGLTETSLLPKAAAAAGLNYAELCWRMVELALRRKVACGC